MTGRELSEAVENYFRTHLDASYWAALDSAKRTAAVSMALDDVLSELPGKTLDNFSAGSFAVKAIAEQAVFLARNYDSLTEGKVVTGETMDGLSNSYSLINANAGMSFRASIFIKKARNAAMGASVRVSRG